MPLNYTPEVWHSPWKMVVGRLLSYWEGHFSGAMFNFGRVFESTAQSVSVQSFSPSSQHVFVVSLGGTFSKPEHYAIINNISWNPYDPCMVYLHVPYKSIIGQHIDPYGKKSYIFSARCCSSINCTVREKTLLLHYHFRVGVANSDFPFEFDACNGFSLGWLEDYAISLSHTIHGTLVYILIHECCCLFCGTCIGKYI